MGAIKDFDVKRRWGGENVTKTVVLVKSHKFPKNIYFQGHYWVRNMRSLVDLTSVLALLFTQ